VLSQNRSATPQFGWWCLFLYLSTWLAKVIPCREKASVAPCSCSLRGIDARVPGDIMLDADTFLAANVVGRIDRRRFYVIARRFSLTERWALSTETFWKWRKSSCHCLLRNPSHSGVSREVFHQNVKTSNTFWLCL